MPPRHCRALLLAVLVVLVCGSVPANGQESLRDAASRLRAAVRAEEARIANTRDGIADANARLAVLQARVNKRNQQLDDTQTALVKARVRLTRLEKKQANAQALLAQNLRSTYMDGEPTFANVVLSADGMSDLIERFEYLRRVSRRNASVLGDLRSAREQVAKQEANLKKARATYARLAREAASDRDSADAIRTALLSRERTQLARRAGAQTRLASVQGRIAAIERRQRAAARAAAAARTAAVAAPQVSHTTGGGGGGGGGGGDVVARVVAAGNEIGQTPYVWGGGHGGASGGYDCSGSISYALAAGGLLNGSLTSGGFMSWGEPGPGRRNTVYAHR